MKLTIDPELNIAVSAELLSHERVKVLKGSEALHNRIKSDSSPYTDRGGGERLNLIGRGILVPLIRDKNRLVFATDHEFDTPTAAADIVFGANKSGREFWKLASNGKSLVEHFGPSR